MVTTRIFDKLHFLLTLKVVGFIFSQEIPNEFFDFKINSFVIDHDQNSWKSHTNFGPIRNSTVNENKINLYRTYVKKRDDDSINVIANIGTNSNNLGSTIYGFGKLNYKNLYSYFYSRIVNNTNHLQRYTGIPRDISRFGYNSGETDISGIGYQDRNFIFQYGRGRQSWGAGEEIQLALSETSPSYDYGLLSFSKNNWRIRYFHGFLESDSSVNRYINGKGVEWTNRKTFVISFSEIVVYAGLNRPLDLAYLNPISSHLEIEMNNRQNKLGTDSGNAVWLGSLDWKLYEKYRFSFNYLIDEFVLDKIQKNQGKNHGLAWSSRLSSANKIKNNMITFYGSIIYVGTNTFRHEDGANNFVQRSKPLGWKYGSDSQQFLVGVKCFNLKNLIYKIDFGYREKGNHSIENTPYLAYDNYYKTPFPSGIINKQNFINAEFEFWYKKNISFYSQFEYLTSNLIDNDYKFIIGFDYYYFKHYKI